MRARHGFPLHPTTPLPSSTVQADAAAVTVAAMREMGRLGPADTALVDAFLGLAEACDTKPLDAALWHQYMATERDLRAVGGADADADAADAFLRYLRGDDDAPPFGGA